MNWGVLVFEEMLNYDWETWKLFFQEHWLILVAALVVLLIIIRLVKTVVKWALVAVIVIVVIIYSGYTLNDLNLDSITSIGTQVADSVKKEAVNAMAGEIKSASYTDNGDGTYTVKTDTLELTGAAGDNEVAVYYRGTSLGKWKVDDTIQSLIEQAKQNG
ncbi:hypothetical protein PATA110616_09455 [Paenibacillus tarimensis]